MQHIHIFVCLILINKVNSQYVSCTKGSDCTYVGCVPSSQGGSNYGCNTIANGGFQYVGAWATYTVFANGYPSSVCVKFDAFTGQTSACGAPRQACTTVADCQYSGCIASQATVNNLYGCSGYQVLQWNGAVWTQSSTTAGMDSGVCISYSSGASIFYCAVKPPCPTSCTSGSYVGSCGCNVCPMGSYCNGTVNLTCTTGTFSSASSMSVCTNCTAGTFTSKTGSTVCTNCATGTITATTGRSVCTNCSVGTFAGAPGLSICTSCGAGTFGSTVALSACASCIAGTFTASTGLSTCFSCPVNAFCLNGSATNCTSTCNSNQYVSSACTSTNNRVCASCPANSFCNGTTATLCDTCLSSQYETTSCTTTTNRACAACPAQSFCNGLSFTNCTVCTNNQYETRACNATVDRVCSSCKLTTGGVQTFINATHYYNQFLTSGTMDIPQNTVCDVLVVAAGGRGGLGAFGGGGGAGEVVYYPALSLLTGIYNVVVGTDSSVFSSRESNIKMPVLACPSNSTVLFSSASEIKISQSYCNTFYQFNGENQVLLKSSTYSVTFSPTTGTITLLNTISLASMVDKSYPIVRDTTTEAVINPDVWYKFDDDANIGYDSMGVAHMTSSGTVDTVVGIKGAYQAKTNGITYLSTTTFPSINAKSFSISCWVKAMDPAGDGGVVFSYNLGATGINTRNCITIALSNTVVTIRFGNDDLIYTSTLNYQNRLIFLTFTFNAVNFAQILYENGVQVATRTAAVTLSMSSPQLMAIARKNFNAQISTSAIEVDDLRLYNNRVLTSAQVSELYKGRFTYIQSPIVSQATGGGNGGSWGSTAGSTNRRFPSKAFTTAGTETTATLNGQTCYKMTITVDTADVTYGSGDYEVFYSSQNYVNDDSRSGPGLFNYVGGSEEGAHWRSNNYATSTGILTTQGNSYFLISDYKGDWVCIKLPVPIAITSYSLTARSTWNNRAPKTFRLYASNDGINWVALQTVTATYTSDVYTNTALSSNTVLYVYYAMVVNSLIGGASSSHIMNFNEWTINGKQQSYTAPVSGGSGGGGLGNRLSAQINSGASAGAPFDSTYSKLNAGSSGTSTTGGHGGSATATGRFSTTITGTTTSYGDGGDGASSSSTPVVRTNYGDGGDGNGGFGLGGTIILACKVNNFCDGIVSQPCSSDCNPSQYENTSCTTSTNRVCVSCPPNYYCNGVKATPCTTCALDQFESLACNSTTNRNCTSCPVNNFCNGVTATPCRAVCNSSEYETSACTSTTNRICAPCPANSFCNGISFTNCTLPCSASQYENSTCTPTTNRVCVSCPFSSFCNGTSWTGCTVCLPSQYETTPCTSTTNRVCNNCPVEAYCNGLNATNCTALCSPTQYESTACTSTTNRICASCPANSYCDGVTYKACNQKCFIHGTYYVSSCNISNDIVCFPCTNKPANSYYVNIGTTATNCPWSCNSGYALTGGSCVACTNKPANSFYNASGTTTSNCPWMCNDGYQLLSGACSLCPQGTFCSSNLIHTCVDNSKSAQGSGSLQNCQCDAGYFGPDLV
jgi:hypothetical protein